MRVLWLDKRGIGCSDGFEQSPTLDERIRDITAVMDAAELDQASVVGLSEGGRMAQLFSARHPERVEKLVLMNTSPGLSCVPLLGDYVEPGERPIDDAYFLELIENLERLVQTWGVDPSFLVDFMMPSQTGNASFARWVGRFQRQSASPADIQRQIESLAVLDSVDCLADIRAPTLVIHAIGDRVQHPAFGRFLADHIENAAYMEFPIDDHFLWVAPSWREIIGAAFEFLVGLPLQPASQRRFAAVLFTDLVGSTIRSARAGDIAWRETLESHDRICREVVEQHAGRIVKHTGDGLLAVFDAPSHAVNAAADLATKLGSIDLEVRAGVHAGELELRDDGDVSGAAVNIAARVEQAAGLGEVYVSAAVRDMLVGSGLQFADRGEHELKGLEGPWRLYSLER